MTPVRTVDPSYAAVVPCGGTSRRMGVPDKTRLVVAGRTVLDHVVSGLADAGCTDVVLVGEERPVATPARTTVRWAREDPPGGGPVAALAAALPLVDTEVVAVVAGDIPSGGSVVPALLKALAVAPTADGVVAVDAGGREQWLLGAWRRRSLAAAVAVDSAGASVRGRLGGLDVRRLAVVESRLVDLVDLDDPGDLDRLGRVLGRG